MNRDGKNCVVVARHGHRPAGALVAVHSPGAAEQLFPAMIRWLPTRGAYSDYVRQGARTKEQGVAWRRYAPARMRKTPDFTSAVLLTAGGLWAVWENYPKNVVAWASLVAGCVIVVGLCMWWPSRDWEALGTTLVGGAVVSLSIFLLQSSFEAEQDLARREARRTRQQELKQLEAARRREDLLLTLGLQRNLYGIDLSGKKLSNAHLAGKILRDADLDRAHLDDAYLRQADLRDASLHRTDLEGAFMIGADLRDAWLFRTDLSSTFLNGADLRGADLYRANLGSAKLEGADLRGVLNWGTVRNLSTAQASFETKWPKGFRPRKHDIQFIETCPSEDGICM